MERKIFFSTLRDSVKTLDATAFICIAGDFNCTICPSIDRNGHEPHVASTKCWKTPSKITGLRMCGGRNIHSCVVTHGADVMMALCQWQDLTGFT